MYTLAVKDRLGEEITYECDSFDINGDRVLLFTIIPGSGMNPLDKSILTAVIRFVSIDIVEHKDAGEK